MQESARYRARIHRGKKVYTVIFSIVWEKIGIKKWQVFKIILYSVKRKDKDINIEKMDKELRVSIKKQLKDSAVRG